jgi:hypothetical protein
MQKALVMQNMIGDEINLRRNGQQGMTDAEYQVLQSRYAQALQEAYLYHSQLGLSNKTEEQKFNPYGY